MEATTSRSSLQFSRSPIFSTIFACGKSVLAFETRTELVVSIAATSKPAPRKSGA